jgi:hypothetical protein
MSKYALKPDSRNKTKCRPVVVLVAEWNWFCNENSDGGGSAFGIELSLDGAIHRGACDVEKLGKLSGGLCAGVVRFQ